MLATMSPPGDDSSFLFNNWETSWTGSTTTRAPKTSETLAISIRAIETLLGWVGQVWVGPDISWEGESWDSPEAALDEARMRVVHVLRNADAG